MLNRLAPVLHPKNGEAKSLYPLFQLLFFILRPIRLNKGFSFFPDWTVGNFLQVGLNQKNQLVQAKKISLINLVPSVPSFYVRTKFRLENCVTTVHLLQRKTNFFIHLRFCGRNLLQIKEYPSWEASIHIKKSFLIRLHQSRFAYTCLVTRLHPSTFVQARLVTRLHSSKLVYIRLDSSSDSNRSKLFAFFLRNQNHKFHINSLRSFGGKIKIFKLNQMSNTAS